jgi:hypothetical protein
MCHEPGRLTANPAHAVCENKGCSMIMWAVQLVKRGEGR